MSGLPTVRVLPSAERAEQPVFYYDLGDPACYLAAEQIMAALPVVPEWEPVHLGALGKPDRALVERRARELGLQPLRWPERWPPDTRRAMLAATYAKRVGRAVAFSLAAFRQAFAAGRDLGEEDTILIAGAACEMHPTALVKGMATRSVIRALDAATLQARRAGVVRLPSVRVGKRIFEDLTAAGDA